MTRVRIEAAGRVVDVERPDAKAGDLGAVALSLWQETAPAADLDDDGPPPAEVVAIAAAQPVQCGGAGKAPIGFAT